MLRRGDERAVSALVGAVLLLGIFVMALSMYQLNVVPNENYQTEIDHNHEVQSQLQDVRNTIVSVPGGGSGGSTTVTLGTSYTQRTFSVNPPSATGTLRTEQPDQGGEIEIKNAVSDEKGGVDEYWDGRDRTWSTHSLEYVPDYNEYRNAPATVYEHGLVYNRFDDASISVTDQVLFDGEKITLVALDGDLSEHSSDSVSIDVQELSTSTNTVPVRNEDADNPLTVTLPSSSPSVWEERTDLEERDEVHEVTADEDEQQVTITLEDGTYDLQMAEVGVGDIDQGSPEERAEYIYYDKDTLSGATIVEVRDEFNNPLENVDITINPNGGSERVESTGSNARIVLEKSSDVSVNNDLSKFIEVRESEDAIQIEPAYNIADVEWDITTGDGGDRCSDGVDVCIEEGGEVEISFYLEVDAGFAEFAIGDENVGKFESNGYSAEFSEGGGEITFDATDDMGEAKETEVWILAGGDSHSLTIEVVSEEDDEDENGETGFDSVAAEDIDDDGTQYLSFTLDSELEVTESVTIDLTDAENESDRGNGGPPAHIDYSGDNNDISVSEGSGAVVFEEFNRDETAMIKFEPEDSLNQNDSIEIRIDEIDTGAGGQIEDIIAKFKRSDKENEDGDNFGVE